MPINSRLLHDSIRQRIKNVRTAEVETRLSQAELGKVLGLNRSTIANIESGLQRASLHHIYELCAHYNLELGDLLPSVAEMRRRSAGTRYEGVDPSLAPVLEKLRSRK
ncbi:MAG: helix-turn-helix domain-containing protein [Proteobacteria bacterium]|nr:helix-turn-helix domain-containing protein [Pseudomonadota bacterium]